MNFHRFCSTLLPDKEALKLGIPRLVSPNDFDQNINILLELMFRKKAFNMSFCHSIGSDPKKLDFPCRQSLLRNHSDISLAPTLYTTETISAQIDYLTDLDHDEVLFISSYIPNGQVVIKRDFFFSSFNCFSIGLWFTIIIVLFFMTFILQLFNVFDLKFTQLSLMTKTFEERNGRRIEEVAKYIPWTKGFSKLQLDFIGQIIHKTFLGYNDFIRRMFCFLLVFFTFTLNLYYNSLLHTDLVSYPPPKTINSLQDIIDSGLNISFVELKFDVKIYGKSFNEIMKKRMIRNKRSEFAVLMAGEPDQFITFSTKSILPVMHSIICQVWIQLNGKKRGGYQVYPWVARDKENPNRFKTILTKRKDYTPHPDISRGILTYFEMGWNLEYKKNGEAIGMKLYRNHVQQMYQNISIKQEFTQQDYPRCIKYSYELSRNDPDFIALNVESFTYLFVICFALSLFSVVILCIENKKFKRY